MSRCRTGPAQHTPPSARAMPDEDPIRPRNDLPAHGHRPAAQPDAPFRPPGASLCIHPSDDRSSDHAPSPQNRHQAAVPARLRVRPALACRLQQRAAGAIRHECRPGSRRYRRWRRRPRHPGLAAVRPRCPPAAARQPGARGDGAHARRRGARPAPFSRRAVARRRTRWPREICPVRPRCPWRGCPRCVRVRRCRTRGSRSVRGVGRRSSVPGFRARFETRFPPRAPRPR